MLEWFLHHDVASIVPLLQALFVMLLPSLSHRCWCDLCGCQVSSENLGSRRLLTACETSADRFGIRPDICDLLGQPDLIQCYSAVHADLKFRADCVGESCDLRALGGYGVFSVAAYAFNTAASKAGYLLRCYLPWLSNSTQFTVVKESRGRNFIGVKAVLDNSAYSCLTFHH